MDLSHLSILATSLGVSRDIGKAMIGIRDFNLVAEKVAALNEQLLKGQDALLAHNALMFQLQNENFEAAKKIRELTETASERGRYSLFEITPGNFVYRVNVTPQTSTAGEPVEAEPLHYLCQTCFEKGVKSILARQSGGLAAPRQNCPTCNRTIYISGATEVFRPAPSGTF